MGTDATALTSRVDLLAIRIVCRATEANFAKASSRKRGQRLARYKAILINLLFHLSWHKWGATI
jgi:hypothetical protein